MRRLFGRSSARAYLYLRPCPQVSPSMSGGMAVHVAWMQPSSGGEVNHKFRDKLKATGLCSSDGFVFSLRAGPGIEPGTS